MTDNYYKLEHDEWVPRIIDDPKLPGLILEGGHQLPLKYTRQRDEVVTWLLFDTGARVSEVCGLMVGDWAALGTKNKAKAFSKGSFGCRVKTISFYAHVMRNEMRFWLRCFHRLVQCSGFLLTSDQKYLCLMKKGKQRSMLSSQITDELHLVAHLVGRSHRILAFTATKYSSSRKVLFG